MEKSPSVRAIALLHAASIVAYEADKADDSRERIVAYLATAQFWCEQALTDLNGTDAAGIARRFAPRLATTADKGN